MLNTEKLYVTDKYQGFFFLAMIDFISNRFIRDE